MILTELISTILGLAVGFVLGWFSHREKKEEVTEEAQKILERLEDIKKYVRQLQSDLNFGYITENQYEVRMFPIIEEICELEKLKDVESAKVEKPVDWLGQIFGEIYNSKIHEMIEEIESERNHREGTEKA